MINNTTFDNSEFTNLHNIVSDAITMVGEVHSGKIHNNTYDINEFIIDVDLLMSMELLYVEPPNTGQFNVEKHNCILLEE